MQKPRILIVDDDDTVRSQMNWALKQDFETLLADSRPSALELLREGRPSAVTLDLGLPPSPGNATEGMLALAEMLEVDPLLKVMVVTGQGEKKIALEAIGQGAYDFFCKPIDIEKLKVVLGRAVQVYELECEHRQLVQSLPSSEFQAMIGSSSPMQAVFSKIRKVATTEAPVLIIGESGTGKELAARAIHRLGTRRDGPFVVINCGAIPENLLESELFGHEKGAFTGAHVQRQGRIEAAQGGTLFLDEVGELPLLLQVKLLRFLQERQIERVGGRTVIPVDARVISATNVDLTKAMTEGTFREDLFYRLGVVVLAMPPLRDRGGDIAVMAKAFLRRYGTEHRKTVALTAKALTVIEQHAWPGNIRELDNRIRRAVIMCEEGKVKPEDLELENPDTDYTRKGLVRAREAVERELIERAMSKHKGNLSRVAAELDISRPTLYDLIEKLRIARAKSSVGNP
jgi:two-component system NtrC family response regulator